jgi:hypothetical protein
MALDLLSLEQKWVLGMYLEAWSADGA